MPDNPTAEPDNAGSHTDAIHPDWLELARSCVSADDWVEIIKVARDEAKVPGANGQKAREFLASFCLPKDRGASAAGLVREVRLVLGKRPEAATGGAEKPCQEK